MAIGTLPTTSSHTSLIQKADLIDMYNGEVDSTFHYMSQMKKHWKWRSLRGTDTALVRRVSGATLQKVTSGVRPDSHVLSTGSTSVTVDTLILARNNVAKLDMVQDDVDMVSEAAEEHGEKLSRFFDESIIINCIKGSAAAAPTGKAGTSSSSTALSGFFAGYNATASTANDYLDADKLYAALHKMILTKMEQDQPMSKYVIYLRHANYLALVNHDKLIDKDYSTSNGDFASGRIKTVLDVPVMPINRFPTSNSAITNHLLGANYNITAAQSKAIAVMFNPKALLAAEAIPLGGNIFYNKTELQWFIDSWISYATNTRRPDCLGCLFEK